MAVGLGTVDMPVPSIAEWEWLNWSFPRQVYAGETVYARWTLTQKRPPAAGAPSSIVVWRVDVHTADGALCAEGEVGAKVKREPRHAARAKPQPAAAGAAGAAAGTAPAAGSRRRRRRSRTNGTVPEPPAVAAPAASTAMPERAAGPSRRRRRRRSGGTAAQQEEHEPRAAHVVDTMPEPPPPDAPAPATGATPARGSREGGLGRVLKRLRRS